MAGAGACGSRASPAIGASSDLGGVPIEAGGCALLAGHHRAEGMADTAEQRSSNQLDADRRLLKEVLRQMPAGVLIAEAPWDRLRCSSTIKVNQVLGTPTNRAA